MYQLKASVPDEITHELQGHDPLIQTLLYNRGITTQEDAEKFLNPNYETDRHDPFLLPDMEKAVARIEQARRDEERVTIYSDYDCDGIPGGVLLHDFFKSVDGLEFGNYIPHRHEEGYGLNPSAIEKIAADGTRLIITVDCGITDNDAVAHASSLGVDVIVTDHHEPSETLPPAHAVINPKRKDNAYPFPELCGTGVAWKLIEALLSRGVGSFSPGHEKWLLDVVGLATIADMVPLHGENRVLAHYGLAVMRKTKRPGLQHLFRGMRLNPRYITEDDIGFMIAPRINAASRMDSPEDAFSMLTTQSESDAGAHARHLEKINNERRGVVAAMVKDIKKRMSVRTTLEDVIVIGNPLWRPALVGLAANSLVEEYGRPVFIWGRDGREVIKGSCRSDGSVSVVTLMDQVKDVLIEYGGHHLSGGFSVHNDHIHTFDARLNEAFHSLGDGADREAGGDTGKFVDADLSLEEVTEATHRKVASLAPFGMGNEKPLFRFRNVVPETVSQFGKSKEHLKVLFKKRDGTIEAIGFFAEAAPYRELLTPGAAVDLIAHIEKSYFMNRPALRLRIVDVVEVS